MAAYEYSICVHINNKLPAIYHLIYKSGERTIPLIGSVFFPRLKESIISTLGRSRFSRRRSGLLLYSMIIF